MHGPTRTRGNDYVEALDAGRRGLADAETRLRAAVLNPDYPPIVRATALVLLRDYLTSSSIDALQAGLSDPAAIVRAAAVRTLEVLPGPDRMRLGRPLLADPVRLVRAWTAASLAGTPAQLMTGADADALGQAGREYLALELSVAERPEAHLNLSSHYARQGQVAEAERALQTALRLDPASVPARVNLADVYRASGREADGERVLREAIRLAPEAAEPYHALGLLLVRTARAGDALPCCAARMICSPRAGASATYAVAMDAQGDTAGAVSILEAVNRARPADADVLSALVAFEEKQGHRRAAFGWAEKLVALRPADADARAMAARLRPWGDGRR